MPQALALGALHPTAARRGLGRLQVRPELGLRQGHQRRRRRGQVVVLVRRRRRLVLRGRLQRGLERGLRLRLRLVRRGQRGVQGPLPGRRRQRGRLQTAMLVTPRLRPFLNPGTKRTLDVAQLHFRCADEGDTTVAPNPPTPEIPQICPQEVPKVASMASRMLPAAPFPRPRCGRKACAEASAQNAACTACPHDLGDGSLGTGRIMPPVSGGSTETGRLH